MPAGGQGEQTAQGRRRGRKQEDSVLTGTDGVTCTERGLYAEQQESRNYRGLGGEEVTADLGDSGFRGVGRKHDWAWPREKTRGNIHDARIWRQRRIQKIKRTFITQ